MELPAYSIGIGDRFGRQGREQLRAIATAAQRGVIVAPIWNKSHREHTIIGSTPADVRAEADAAVAALAWENPYFVDADHVGAGNLDLFLAASDFFTLDVAEEIGQVAAADDRKAFAEYCKPLLGTLDLPGTDQSIEITPEAVEQTARTFLAAVKTAGTLYRRIREAKGQGNFVTEVSMDEADTAQTPQQLLLILAAIAAEGIDVRTIAPKFTGRFNKGVDYVGDVSVFAAEFRQDLAAIALAVETFSLPAGLKLSVHSGSDKFSLYGPIREALGDTGAGLHLKTAGTTWLEELSGLAASGVSGLEIAKQIYAASLDRYDELAGPYAPVIDIDRSQLPAADAVNAWDAAQFTAALTHEPACPDYNLHVRQLLHVAYKLAAEMGSRYLDALDAAADAIGRRVTENILVRHMERIFPGVGQ